MKKLSITAIMIASMLLTSGCTFMAPSYTPDYSALDSLKRQKVSTIAVEPVEPKDPDAKVNNISLRGSTLKSPSGSYAKYLEDAIISDLTDAKLLDQNSLFRLSVWLLKNDIDVSSFSNGYGVIEARFNVNRDGVSVFNKRIAEQTVFESSIAGAVAIPKGQGEYPNLVRALLKKLYTDREFIDALKK
jgi:hypothetical protein